jgi:hypothetical protein
MGKHHHPVQGCVGGPVVDALIGPFLSQRHAADSAKLQRRFFGFSRRHQIELANYRVQVLGAVCGLAKNYTSLDSGGVICALLGVSRSTDLS